MIIKTDDLTDRRTLELIEIHLAGMEEHSPTESRHALTIEGLKQANITFYSAWGSKIHANSRETFEKRCGWSDITTYY